MKLADPAKSWQGRIATGLVIGQFPTLPNAARNTHRRGIIRAAHGGNITIFGRTFFCGTHRKSKSGRRFGWRWY